MRRRSVHERGVGRGRGLSALQPVCTGDQRRDMARVRCARLSTANQYGRSMVSMAGCYHDLAGQTISPQGGMLV
jgi:hypothetical protein